MTAEELRQLLLNELDQMLPGDYGFGDKDYEDGYMACIDDVKNLIQQVRIEPSK